MGVTGFGLGNPSGPCNGGDLAWFEPSWDVGPSIDVGSDCVV